jgi:subtilisin-like proprotein convertase family protein
MTKIFQTIKAARRIAASLRSRNRQGGKLLVVMLAAGAFTAQGQTNYFVGLSGIDQTIPDGNPNGIFSQISASDIPATLLNVSVNLDITGGYDGDLYAYLLFNNGSSPATQVILLNRIGNTAANPFGSQDPGLDVTFSDSALTDIHLAPDTGNSPLTGTFQVDGRNVNPQLVLDTSLRSTFLNSFDGVSPDGTWTLFVADMAGGDTTDTSTLVSWGINITVAPEPNSFSLLVVGLGIIGIVMFFRGKAQRSTRT